MSLTAARVRPHATSPQIHPSYAASLCPVARTSAAQRHCLTAVARSAPSRPGALPCALGAMLWVCVGAYITLILKLNFPQPSNPQTSVSCIARRNARDQQSCDLRLNALSTGVRVTLSVKDSRSAVGGGSWSRNLQRRSTLAGDAGAKRRIGRSATWAWCLWVRAS
jgi:hypothetical protein